VAEPDLYLFDGHNLLYAAGSLDREELVNRLASFVSLRGARGVVVFDGVGLDASHGALEVRHAYPADRLLERLAAEHRDSTSVCLVSSDQAIRGTSGQAVRHLSSQSFLAGLANEGDPSGSDRPPLRRLGDSLDEETRSRLERLRRRRH
jgi:predicted RNA-binding protein with PIN domain